MPLALTARFLLGTYTGHSPSGEPELVPDFARAFSALVQAAACGTQSSGDAEDPYTSDARQALLWLERNPPSALHLPSAVPLAARQGQMIFRNEGVFHKEGNSIKDKVGARPLSTGSAVAGPLQWIWAKEPPEVLTSVIDRICADVPHLGETSSPITLGVEDPQEPTHVLDSEAGYMTSGALIRQSVPSGGRLDELDAAHRAVTGGKLSAAADKHSTSALPYAPSPSRERVVSAYYRAVELPEALVPWPHVFALPVSQGDGLVQEEHMVSICVAMHRTIVSRLGPEASSSITGRYPAGTVPPVNRLALHLLPGDTPGSPFQDRRDRMLVLVPREADAQELTMVATALEQCHRIATRDVQIRLEPAEMEILDGQTFWNAPPEGHHRLWEASPAVVPERRLPHLEHVSDLDLAAAWSLGNVLRGLEPQLGSKSAEDRLTAAQHAGAGFWCRALRTARPRSYVHKTDRAHPVHPYRATLDLGNLMPSRGVMAIGQSRHLGCGLLIPVDRPMTPRGEDS